MTRWFTSFGIASWARSRKVCLPMQTKPSLPCPLLQKSSLVTFEEGVSMTLFSSLWKTIMGVPLLNVHFNEGDHLHFSQWEVFILAFKTSEVRPLLQKAIARIPRLKILFGVSIPEVLSIAALPNEKRVEERTSLHWESYTLTRFYYWQKFMSLVQNLTRVLFTFCCRMGWENDCEQRIRI